VTLRQGVLTAGQSLSSAFNSASTNLSNLRSSEDTQVPTVVQQINTLAQSIAGLNLRISQSQASGQQPGVLEDQRNELIRKMSELVSFPWSQGNNGAISVSTALGAPLVVGEQSFKLQTATSPNHRHAASTVVYWDGPYAGITGGQLGGILRVRDQAVPDLQNKLDTLAAGVANAVNTAHQAGFDLNGAPDRNCLQFR